MKNKKTYVLIAVLVGALTALAWINWPTLQRLTATRLPEPTPVKPESLPLATRAAHLFWSGRYAEFESMLERSLANVANPSAIESLLSRTCDQAPAAQREAQRWLDAKPATLWPQLCLGRAFVKHGLQRRGTEFSMNTRPEQFARMVRAFDDAYVRLVPFYNDTTYQRAVLVPLLTLLQFSGGASTDTTIGDYDAVYQRGVKSFPTMGNLYSHRMENLRPQWGGSVQKMEAFVDEARARGALPKTIEYLAATAAAVRNFEQWKGNPQKPASELEAQIGRDLGGDAYENLADDLIRMGSPTSGAKARNESVRLYPDATMPLVRRGYALLAKGDAKAAYADFVAAANRGDYWALDRVTSALTYGVDGIAADQARLRPWVEHGVSIGHGMSEQLLV